MSNVTNLNNAILLRPKRPATVRHTPTHNQILIERLNYPKESVGGIALPGQATANGPLQRGRVLAIGPGFWTGHDAKLPTRMPMCCKPGDVILARPNDMFLVNPFDSKIAILPDQAVVCIETEDSKA